MKSFALVRQGSDEVIAWACGVCGLVHSANDREWAEKCCKCCYCGEELEENRQPSHGRKSYHDECWRKAQDESERKAMDKAQEVPYTDEMILWGDHWCYDPQDFVDRLLDSGMKREDFPEFVFASKKVLYRGLDIEDALHNSVEEIDEDGAGVDQLSGVEALEKAVKEFNALNKDVYWYEEDRKSKWRVSDMVGEVDEAEQHNAV